MTIAELERVVESKRRVMKREAQERATYDYILGDLIGRSIGRIYNSKNQYPEIFEIYPSLFESETINEEKRNKQVELSALRFKQFAHSYNKNFKEVSKDN